MRAYAVCVRFHQVGATRGYYSRVGQPPQVASGASPPFIPSCLLSLLHPYKGGDMGGRRAYYSARVVFVRMQYFTHAAYL